MYEREIKEFKNIIKSIVMLLIICIIFTCGCVCGSKMNANHYNYIKDKRHHENTIQAEETLEADEVNEREELDEKDIKEQRERYFEELGQLKFKGVCLFKSHNNYRIKTPSQVYEDFDCTIAVEEDPIVQSVYVVEIILNEDQSRYGLRTENNKLVWVKEEPRIEKRQ